MPASLLTVKDLSRWLTIKPSTLYAWAAEGKIPSCRLHGALRFDPEAVARWLQACHQPLAPPPAPRSRKRPPLDVDAILARATRTAYNPAHGETRPTASPEGKEGEDGAR